MLALLGFLTIAAFLFLIMTRRVSVTIALIVVPFVFALFGGFGTEIGQMMLEGIKKVTPTALIPIFAVLYFGIMIDAGLFDPMISRILRIVKGDPVKIVLGTVLLTTLVALDGDGTTTFMITVSAMLPIYRALGMNPLILSGVVGLAAGVMNLLPWGGPTTRVMATLHADSTTIFNPLIPAMLAGMAWVFFVAYLFGKKERERLGVINMEHTHKVGFAELAASTEDLSGIRRPKLFWFNLVLTVVLIVALIMVWLPLPILFILAFAIALQVNYPNFKDQQQRLASHANNVLVIATLIFAAGCFTGILSGTKMIDAMATTMVSLIPDSMAGHLPVIVALTSMPLSLVFPTDAYYFGVLPIIYETASSFGIDPVQIGQAAVLGHMTVGFPLSPLAAATLVLIGMSGVDLGEHQRFIFKWAFGSTVVMTIVAILTGVISI